jgi:ribosomal protein S18 acetylase RimI-like enzyme
VTETPSAVDVRAAAAAYVAAFSAPPYEESLYDVPALRKRLVVYSERDGFRLCLASIGDRCVGLSLSAHAVCGDWWRDRACAAVSPALAKEWFQGRIREIVHVGVAPDAQRKGLGSALVQDALDDPAVTAVVLSCRGDVPAAQFFSLRAGFTVLSRDFRLAPGDAAYWLLARRPMPAAVPT